MPQATGGITVRELIDLQSHLMLENNLVGQFNHFARECTDPQLGRICQDLARSRMQCFQLLAKHTTMNMIQ